MNEETKSQLAKAKQLIQAKQFEKAKEILWDIDHPTATKWLMRLDELDSPQPHSQIKPKAQPANGNQMQIIKIAVIAICIVIIGVFIVSQFIEQQRIKSRLEESQQAIDDASDYCHDFGYRGTDFADCLDRKMAYFHCKDVSDAEYESCLVREMPSYFQESDATATLSVTFTPIGADVTEVPIIPTSTKPPTPQPQDDADGKPTPFIYVPPTPSK